MIEPEDQNIYLSLWLILGGKRNEKTINHSRPSACTQNLFIFYLDVSQPI